MASRNRLGYLVGVSLLALATSAATAKAATLVGLTADNKLVKIDTATMAASAPMAISGADQVVGIDVRPADGKLYGLTAAGQLVVIDHMSGKATAGSRAVAEGGAGRPPGRRLQPGRRPAARHRRRRRRACASTSTMAPPRSTSR